MYYIHMFFTAIATLMYGAIGLVMMAVHVATTYFAWKITDSVLYTILTFVSPPISEMWWAISAWVETGIFFNPFTLMILGVIALYVLQVVIFFLMTITEPKTQ